MIKNRVNLIKIFMIVIVSSALFMFVACSNNKIDESIDKTSESNEHLSSEHDDSTEEHSKLQLSKKEIDEFGIKISMAGPGIIKEHIDLTGEIIMDPARIAHIKPRFSGIVKQIKKTIGDHVKKGETIAVIESNESLANYKLYSSIEGIIIEMHMTLGENVGDDSHTITVADLSEVWANLSVYQKDLLKIKKGQTAIISAGESIIDFKGTIDYISPVLDETTRTVPARVVLDNREKKWKPGVFITAEVVVGEKKVEIVIEKTALTLYNGNNIVFVKENGKFVPQPVSIGAQNRRTAEILSGLHAGQEYVSKGVFVLKAELQKDSFGDEH